MSADRRQKLGRLWGGIILLVQLRVLYVFWLRFYSEVSATAFPDLEQVRTRVSHLRPILLRSPAIDVFLVSFLVVSTGIAVTLWVLAARRWWRDSARAEVT